MLNKQKGQFRVSIEQINKILESGLWCCPACGSKFHITKQHHPLLIWWPVRMGKATGPDGVFVEKIDNYSLAKIF